MFKNLKKNTQKKSQKYIFIPSQSHIKSTNLNITSSHISNLHTTKEDPQSFNLQNIFQNFLYFILLLQMINNKSFDQKRVKIQLYIYQIKLNFVLPTKVGTIKKQIKYHKYFRYQNITQQLYRSGQLGTERFRRRELLNCQRFHHQENRCKDQAEQVQSYRHQRDYTCFLKYYGYYHQILKSRNSHLSSSPPSLSVS
eukprot:TRINITY_DN97429_c0_g2_i5.p1 TRINITY_DN97429_c0_g2~~TRINITY_DN97429_c0_g2_i5.p1  ORF type:complete len:197 (+),score=-14.27 TRINITY_DN97429_c0_g2_i5:220-810(+)